MYGVWYWHLLGGLLYCLGTFILISSYGIYLRTQRGSFLPWFALLIFLAASLVNALH
jgi:hypothetical protein